MIYDSFIFEGHGLSEVTGKFDSGAVNGSVTENYLVDAISKSAKKYLDKTGLTIHYDENNFTDKDLAGNTYSFKFGVELHINSANGASGVEIFVPCKEKSVKSDIKLCADIATTLGIPNRGVKSKDYNSGKTFTRTDGQALNYTDYYGAIRDAWNRGVSLALIEFGFIQNDLSKLQANIDNLGYLVAKYIAENCNKTVSKPSDSSQVTEEVKPSTQGKKGLIKVIKDGVSYGAYSVEDNAINAIKKAIKDGFSKIILEGI